MDIVVNSLGNVNIDSFSYGNNVNIEANGFIPPFSAQPMLSGLGGMWEKFSAFTYSGIINKLYLKEINSNRNLSNTNILENSHSSPVVDIKISPSFLTALSKNQLTCYKLQ